MIVRPRVWGHRGTRSSAQKPGPAENTLAAMRMALEQGADGIELDVRLCGSGEVIVLHDVDLMRMAGVAIRAQDATLQELQAHDLGGGERVPLLDQAMDLVLEHGARAMALNVEIKPDVPDPLALVAAVVERIAARDAQQRERVIVSSFSAQICEAVHAALPALAVAFLFDRLDAVAAMPSGMTAVHPHHLVLNALSVARFRGMGVRIHTWTVNDPARAGELAALGVDVLITDNVPAVLVAL